jgi:prevent-host-death family protein
MVSVGVRELKGRLSQYLRRVKTGERLAITERGKTVAVLSPPAESGADRRIAALLQDGLAQWDGGKPKGAARPAQPRGAPVADAVIEDRR